MSVTGDVLVAVCRKAAGDVTRGVTLREIGAATALDSDEVRSAVRALELTGMLLRDEGGSGVSATVRITAEGLARCGNAAPADAGA